MKHSKSRRILSALLAAVVVLAALPAVGFAGGDHLPVKYATVRIEANGFGTDGTENNIGTVLEYTVVDLSKLTDDGTGYKAIDVVNKALSDNGKAEAAEHPDYEGFYTAFDGVYGQSGESWGFMLNNESATVGLNNPTIEHGDEIVLMLTKYDSSLDLVTTGYAYFRITSFKSEINSDYGVDIPYAEVTLALKNVKQGVGWTWNPENAINVDIYSNGSQAWTPESSPATTDSDNGMGTITLWGGTDPGTYTFDITAEISGSTSAFCRATMVCDGTNPPELYFSAPQSEDTTLSSLTVIFSGAAPSDGLLYVGGKDLEVPSTVGNVAVSAVAKSRKANITATYKRADAESAADYEFNDEVDLAVGQNTFKLTVTNGEDMLTYTLHIVRSTEEPDSNITAGVEEVLNGIEAHFPTHSDTDWILALNAAGSGVNEGQKTAFLSNLLLDTADFAHDNVGNPATMAKAAIALTSLGIDARKVKDLYGGEDIDLVKKIGLLYDAKTAPGAQYSAPYILSLFDLPGYDVPTGSRSTRAELIDAILGSEDDWGFDGAGMVLPALAPYYTDTSSANGISDGKCNEIRTVINRTLDKISQEQTVDGSLGAPNSSTVSTVITGLNAIDINAHTDSQFTKAGTSLLMNLLSFRTANNTLGFTDASKTNDYASLQGFQALATWQNLTNASGRSSNLYHFTKAIGQYNDWPEVKILTGLKILSLPATTTFDYNSAETSSAPDTSGIVLRAIYNRDESKAETIDISKCTVSTIDLSRPGTQTVFITYTENGVKLTAQYFVIILNKEGKIPTPTTASVTVRNGNRTLASSSAEPIQPNVTTALDVLESTLKAAGIDYKIERSGYVKEIDGIGEFSTGTNTGWMYSVNGTTPPTTAAADYKLKDGDVVRWYYTEDYTKDPSSKGWSNQEPDALEPQATIANGTASATLSASDLSAAIQSNTGTTLTIEPTGTKGANAVEVNIPAASAASIASDTALDLSVVTPVGTVTMPNDALGSIASQANGSITIRVESVDTSGLSTEQQQAVGQDPVYDISILSGGTQISSFGGKAITISLPYELKEDEDASGVAVWYLNDAGELQRMRCTYDPATGMATFETTHLSKYLVGYSDAWYNPFEDVRTGDWFYDAVAFAASNQLFDGVSKTAFAPDQSMTRAMLATVLHRVEGSPAATAAADFGDVESGQWYSEAIAWATERGITKGYDSRTFGTNDSVTREQMAEILYRYAEYKKLDVSARADVSAFDDGTSISSWAEQGVSWAVSTGLIQGVSATKLAPSALSTRAQVATVLMRWLGEK